MNIINRKVDNTRYCPIVYVMSDNLKDVGQTSCCSFPTEQTFFGCFTRALLCVCGFMDKRISYIYFQIFYESVKYSRNYFSLLNELILWWFWEFVMRFNQVLLFHSHWRSKPLLPYSSSSSKLSAMKSASQSSVCTPPSCFLFRSENKSIPRLIPAAFWPWGSTTSLSTKPAPTGLHFSLPPPPSLIRHSRWLPQRLLPK